MSALDCEKTHCVICGADSFSLEASGYDYEYRASENEFFFVKCRNCGHIYLNPRPVAAVIRFLYPDNYYTKSGRHRHGRVATAKRLVIRRRLSFFKNIFQKQSVILELGCGDCELIKDIKMQYPWCSVTGVDLSLLPEVAQQCRIMGIKIVETDMERMALPDNTYDLIIMNQLIEHLHYPDEALKKIFKSLKPGGMISIETPNVDGYDRKFVKRSFWGGYYFPRHMNLFSTETISRLLNAAGLKVIKQIPLVAPIIWIFSISASINKRFPMYGSEGGLFAWIFSDRNPLTLAVFSAIDMAAILLGTTTSNQKIIARKPSAETDGV